ncbi:hypothetical protein ES703_48765 [subsurface metagenome]
MFELWRKTRELDRVTKFHDRKIKKARREKKSSDEVEFLIADAAFETEMIEEEMSSIVTNRLHRKARHLFLPVPKFEEKGMWEQGRNMGHWYLTPNGITKIRGLIREETAARRKAVLEWVAPFVGIIGAITGLLAVIFAMT